MDFFKNFSQPKVISKDINSWDKHYLSYDSDIRKESFRTLEFIQNVNEIHLGYTRKQWESFDYNHYFVTIGNFVIEFSLHKDKSKYTVNINKNMRSDFHKDATIKMNREICSRILHVLGMDNYSFFFRNDEHVANYIIKDKWESTRSVDKDYSKYLENHIRLENNFPSCIRLHPQMFKSNEPSKKIYEFIEDHFVASNFGYFLDRNDDTAYNILVVGPAGAAKSHIINVFFNQEICNFSYAANDKYVEVYFIQAKGKVYDAAKKIYVDKPILVADTMGLETTENIEIMEIIKSRASCELKFELVWIVLEAGRLPKALINNIKKLRKSNNIRFSFVVIGADYLSQKEKDEYSIEIKGIFDINTTENDSLIYVDFPPQEVLNELTTTKVKQNWNNLKLSLQNGVTRSNNADDVTRSNNADGVTESNDADTIRDLTREINNK